MMKRLIALLMAMAVLLALAGCGAEEAEPTKSPVQNETADVNAPAVENGKPYEGTTISVLGNSSTDSTFMQEHLDEFTAETGIKVEYQQLTNDQLNSKILVSMAAGGKDLDVFMFMAFQNTKQYVQNGWLEPLDSYVQGDPEFDIDDYMTGGLEASSVDGTLYGIPHGSEYGIVFYNKTMIKDAGIDVNAIKTYEDLLEACKTVEDKLPGTKGIALRGQGNGAVTVAINLVRAYGGDFIDENGKAAINSDAFCKGIEMYRNLLNYAQEGASTMSWSETCNVFAQRQTAFRIDSDAQYTYLIDPDSSLVSEEELGFLPLPAGDVCASTTLGNWSIGMSYGSQNKGAAWEFIRWMNTKENVIARCLEQQAAPARNSAWENEDVASAYPDGYAEVSIQSGAIASGGPLPNMLYSSEARTAIGEAYDAIFAGGDVRENLNAANAVMQDLLNQEAAEAE